MEDTIERIVKLYFQGHSVSESLKIVRKENGPFAEDPRRALRLLKK